MRYRRKSSEPTLGMHIAFAEVKLSRSTFGHGLRRNPIQDGLGAVLGNPSHSYQLPCAVLAHSSYTIIIRL